MNIKIKATGIACLLGDDYDRVYTALTRQFGKGTDCLFTERIAGHEYLQWILPGEGWTALAQGDPIMTDQVRQELKTRRQAVVARFGANVDMAHRVLTVPDDEYVYYKADVNGSIDIKLTAWGYRYPERVDGGNATGMVTPNATTENVSVKITYNGEPVPGKEFKINDFKRVTDEKGMLTIGNLPIGYQFDIEADGISRHCIVTAGESVVELDCTVYANVEMTVKKDGVPAADAAVNVNYEGHSLDLRTDTLGHASARMPLSLTGSLCIVTVECEKQQKSLKAGLNAFDFALVTPVVPPEILADPGPDDEEDKKGSEEENKVTEEEKKNDPKEEVKNEDEKEEEKKEEEKEEEEKKPEEKTEPVSKGWILMLILLLLILAVLTALTYYFCKGMLFG